MARSDSWVGLSPRGRAMVANARARVYAEHNGLCDLFELHAYTLPDGQVVREVVQTSIWSSGPSWFLTLETPDGTRVPDVDWTNQELADHMGIQVNDALPTITPDEAEQFAEWEPWIDKGTLHLDWATKQKFTRWRAARDATRASAQTTR